jgi:hypothetical protein
VGSAGRAAPDSFNYDYGSESQSRRLTVMEPCNDDEQWPPSSQHASSLSPDLKHFYYQRQQVDMGPGMAADLAGMGPRRAQVLPRQDLSLRRSTSLIAQARHHHNTNSPTNNY